MDAQSEANSATQSLLAFPSLAGSQFERFMVYLGTREIPRERVPAGPADAQKPENESCTRR